MTRLIYLTSNHSSPDPLESTWTARWDGVSESGRTVGEAVDRIVRHAPDGRLDRLVLVLREGPPLDLGESRQSRARFRPADRLLTKDRA